MNVLILNGSPHKDGTTSYLIDSFKRGLAEAGHQVRQFDCAFHKIHPCIVCNECRTNGGRCVFEDDMKQVREDVRWADGIAIVSPVYFFGFTSQLKAVLDRLHAEMFDQPPRGKKSLLITAMSLREPLMAKHVVDTYEAICLYWGWEMAPTLLCEDAGTPKDLEGTDYLDQAYERGKNF